MDPGNGAFNYWCATQERQSTEVFAPYTTHVFISLFICYLEKSTDDLSIMYLFAHTQAYLGLVAPFLQLPHPPLVGRGWNAAYSVSVAAVQLAAERHLGVAQPSAAGGLAVCKVLLGGPELIPKCPGIWSCRASVVTWVFGRLVC